MRFPRTLNSCLKKAITLFSLTLATIHLPAHQAAAASLINNGDFSRGMEAWHFFTSAPQNRASTNKGAITLNIAQSSQNVQLYQTNIPITQGRRYTLSFIARANKPVSIPVYIHRHGGNFENLGLYGNALITSTQKTLGLTPNNIV